MIKLLCILLILLSTSLSAQVKFGEKVFEYDIESFIQNKSIGDLKVQIKNEKVIKIHSMLLKSKLSKILEENHYKNLILNQEWIEVDELPYGISYSPESLKLNLDIPANHFKSDFYSLELGPHLKYESIALKPAPIGGSFNFILERSYSDDYYGEDFFSSYLNSNLNIHGIALSSTGTYFEEFGDSNSNYWIRGDTLLTKDFEESKTRLQIGDTNSQSFGFMQGMSIGGVNIKRQFSIDPYTRPFPQGEREFSILTRSRVKTFINGSLIKDEILPAGNYKLSNMPLVNGLNLVRVEIENDSGEKKILEFNLATSILILKKGEFNYSLSSGKPINDIDNSREYSKKNLSSAFVQYGFSNHWSSGIYAQNIDDYNLTGIVNGLATDFGNYYIGNSFYNQNSKSGSAASLTWQFQNIGGLLFAGHSYLLRYEKYFDEFRDNYLQVDEPLDDNIEANISFPLSSKISVSIGGGLANYQDSSYKARKTLRSNINWRITNAMNLNSFFSNSTDRNNNEINILTLFLTWSFDKVNQYFSLYQDVTNKNTRLSYTADNSNQIYKPRFNANVESDDDYNRANISSQLPTPMATFTIRGANTQANDNKSYSMGSISMASSFLFAIDDGLGYAISRPSSSSFAIFKPSENLKDQKLAIRSTSPYFDTQSPIIGDLALTNLIPYQYREIQIDPTFLKPGTSLLKEKFILRPSYKSAHLIKIKDNGTISAQGILKHKGKIISLQVGQINENIFFTDANGFFYFESITKGSNILKIENIGSAEIMIDNKARGIIELGTIELK